MAAAKIILTNDDGIDAPGLAALRRAVEGAATVIAPTGPLSGCSHRVTTHGPIEVESRGGDAFAVDGTPADCVRIGLHHLCPEAEYVFSGINPGGNLGADAFLSGTVAAVREGAFHGVPGMAISHYVRKGLPIDWDRAIEMASAVIESLWQIEIPPGSYWNVNLPHLAHGDPDPECVICESCRQPLHVKYRVEGSTYYFEGEYSARERDPDCDADVCFSGNIAVTLLSTSSDTPLSIDSEI